MKKETSTVLTSASRNVSSTEQALQLQVHCHQDFSFSLRLCLGSTTSFEGHHDFSLIDVMSFGYHKLGGKEHFCSLAY